MSRDPVTGLQAGDSGSADREDFLRSFCEAAVARAKAQAEEIDWDSISEEESEHASEVYELSYSEITEKDAEAKEELDKLRDQGDELIVGLDQERQELQRVWDRTILKREHQRSNRIFKLHQARTNLLHRRRTSRERRPSCTRRSGGSRVTRAGPDDSGDSDPDGEHHPLAARGTAGAAR